MTHKPYGLMADCHLHNWNQFSSIDKDGTNSRLEGLLNEMNLCVQRVRKEGGNTVVIAGDLFHVRGNIKPSVYNRAVKFFQERDYIDFYILAGNHDLETKVADDHSSALTALSCLPNVHVANGDSFVTDRFILIPWIESISLEILQDIVSKIEGSENKDLILHAPIDGVFDNIPSEGLSPTKLTELPVKRVFSGHFHNYKKLADSVYSVGSIAQFFFGESGNSVGWCLVDSDNVTHIDSSQPEFQTVTLKNVINGNYKRGSYLKINVEEDIKQTSLEKLREKLINDGSSSGLIFQVTKKSQERSDYTASSGVSLETSVSDYINTLDYKNDKDILKQNCLRVLEVSKEN